MKYLAMIQARCGSTRLPNKVIMDLCGKTVLEQMILRVERSKLIDEVMVITSIEKINLPILNICAQMGIRVGIGSESDVLDRYYQTAKLINPEYIIRLTADCPCFDPGLLDLAIEQLDYDTDYLGMLTDSFADGLDLEIIKFSALKTAWECARLLSEREHVTPYIKNHKELFNIRNFESPIGNFGNYRFTVDEPEDLEVVRNIFNYFFNVENNPNFNYLDILNYLKNHPEIENINNSFIRNEGYLKSLENDKNI